MERTAFNPSERRPLLVQLFAIAFLLCLLPLSVSAEPEPSPEVVSDADTWRLFRGDSFGSGLSSSTLPDQLEVVWRYEVKDGAFASTPVIANGRVYIGDLDGHVFCLRLDSGKEVWKKKYETGFVAAPAIKNGRVYLGDFDGMFYCLDADSGESKWTFESGAEISAGANFFEGKVIFASQDASLYCLNAETGELTWKHTLQDQIQSYPTIVEGKCFVAGCDQMLHIVDINRGVDVDQVDIASPTCVTPAVFGNQVVFGTEGGEVLAVDWVEAKIKWRFRDGRRRQSIRSSPAITEDWVVIGSRNKRVYGIETSTGEKKWTFSTRSRVDSAPVIVGDRVFFGGDDGRLYELELATGKKVWEYEAGASFAGSPAVANQRLVIANDAGIVYAFGKK